MIFNVLLITSNVREVAAKIITFATFFVFLGNVDMVFPLIKCSEMHLERVPRALVRASRCVTVLSLFGGWSGSIGLFIRRRHRHM